MKFIKKTDVIIIAGILIAAGAAWLVYSAVMGRRAVCAEIYCHSKPVMRVNLDRDATFSIPQNENVVFCVRNGSIRFESSDCPEKICIRSGRLSLAGQSATCLPNGITVKVVPIGDLDAPDAVIGN